VAWWYRDSNARTAALASIADSGEITIVARTRNKAAMNVSLTRRRGKRSQTFLRDAG
jgi:hypothetical protein